MNEQPEALRLADELDKTLDLQARAWTAAKELRRLTEVNESLRDQNIRLVRKLAEMEDALDNVHSYYQGLRYEAASLRDQNTELDRRLAEMEQQSNIECQRCGRMLA
jgi:cell division septum initiation protein DivIVA